MPTIVYDTGALLAAERHNLDFLALHDELTRARIRPLVPVVVLAQAWRGGPSTRSPGYSRPATSSPTTRPPAVPLASPGPPPGPPTSSTRSSS